MSPSRVPGLALTPKGWAAISTRAQQGQAPCECPCHFCAPSWPGNTGELCEPCRAELYAFCEWLHALVRR